mmetsp:Transcript_19764/g.3238  ORF Transcript_19764/g.3238 Transcript_19764/m.3238 type:complete len:103 (+) Transcript_19764:267-575(+)
MICGAFECPFGMECVKSLDNPNNGLITFDNIYLSFINVFICSTLEGWPDIMEAVERSVSRFSIFYFMGIIYIGAFFLMNLILAVIKMKFTEIMLKYGKKKIK